MCLIENFQNLNFKMAALWYCCKIETLFTWSFSAEKNDEKWLSNHFSIITITNLDVFLPCRRGPLMISWRLLGPFSLLILCFLGAGHLLKFLLNNSEKKIFIFFDLPPRSKLIFYVWVNSPEKMMRNGGRIIFLSTL